MVQTKYLINLNIDVGIDFVKSSSEKKIKDTININKRIPINIYKYLQTYL